MLLALYSCFKYYLQDVYIKKQRKWVSIFVYLQDSLTAEDFAFSEGLPGNKNNYTLTYRFPKCFLSLYHQLQWS